MTSGGYRLASPRHKADNDRAGGSSTFRWRLGLVLTLAAIATPVLAGLVMDRVGFNRAALTKQELRLDRDEQEITALRLGLTRNDTQHEAIIAAVKSLQDDLDAIQGDLKELRRESKQRRQ